MSSSRAPTFVDLILKVMTKSFGERFLNLSEARRAVLPKERLGKEELRDLRRVDETAYVSSKVR